MSPRAIFSNRSAYLSRIESEEGNNSLKMFQIQIIFAAILMVSTISSKPTIRKCGGKAADITFVVDTSSSIWPPDFKFRMLPFISDVVEMFDLGPGKKQARVAMVTFGSTYYHQFHLKDYQDKDALIRRIENTTYKGGNTKTNEALDYVSSDVFSRENGARDGVARVIIVLTDGKSDDGELTKAAAALAKGKGMRIFAIGVGFRVDYVELADMASKPDKEFVFHVGNFKALDRIKKQLAIRACSVTRQKPSTTTTTTTTTTIKPSSLFLDRPYKDQPQRLTKKTECRSKPADIYFILDVSASLYSQHFYKKVIPFVSSIVSYFDISPDHTRVGVVTFSTKVNSVFSLDRYTSRDDLLTAISNIKHVGGHRTHTAKAIAHVRDIGFDPFVVRKGVPKIAIVITDGMSFRPRLTAREARAAKAAGINMFAIGVGPSIDPKEMAAIGSEPEYDFVFHAQRVEALDSLKDVLKEGTCNIKGAISTSKPGDCVVEPTDLMFVFESASKSPVSRRITRRVITDFAEKLKVTAEQVHVGSLTDPCPHEDAMSLLSLEAFTQKVHTIVRNTEGQMHRLLNKLRKEVFVPRTTSGQRQVAVLFLDRRTRRASRVVKEAKRLKRHGVEVYVVAIGDVAEHMVAGAASSGVEEHVIRLQSYRHLKFVKLDKLWNICSDSEK